MNLKKNHFIGVVSLTIAHKREPFKPNRGRKLNPFLFIVGSENQVNYLTVLVRPISMKARFRSLSSETKYCSLLIQTESKCDSRCAFIE